MLDSLYIKNYRNLKELTLKSLGQITLLTGKNNTGKSSVLEAIAIYVAKGDIRMIYELLERRGELNRRTSANTTNIVDYNLKAFCSLFTNREQNFEEEHAILIGDNKGSRKLLSLRLVKYFETQSSEQGLPKRKNIVSQVEMFPYDNLKGLEIKFETKSNILSFEFSSNSFRFRPFVADRALEFVHTDSIDKATNSYLWDKIIFSEKENYVIEALQTIEPTIERLAFIGDNQNERTAIIKLSNVPNTLPLRSMGDGINRILTIILALVNAENGYLLIDEFENGLHHSVQSKLWEIIFSLAQKLNVQVFATTHSKDCIYAFEESLNDKNNTLTGKLIRLDNKKGMIKEVEFDAEDLRVFTDNQMEIR